ncbi:probable carboxylesterase 7 [Cornus florida]|uniref:probable carboxylesterase 7 n=1 Tax=Cornus florida TaxID=4283 RepID=UPI00289CABD6|nr:probable carboxylesterase 7 [Cornus florida]
MGNKMSSFYCLFIFFFSVASSTLLHFDVSPFLPLFSGPKLEIEGFMNMYHNNTIERLDDDIVPPSSTDPKTSVKSKDVVISPQNGVSARLYIPISIPTLQGHKLPLVIYIHGGGFCSGSAFNPIYHNYVSSLVANANVVALSINYREAPEHPIPAAYQDSSSALRWVAQHSKGGGGGEAWLNDYVDFQSVYLVGDVAGANIAHNVAMWAGQEDLEGFMLAGMVLMSPFFWGKKPIGEHEPKEIQIRNLVHTSWYVATGMKIELDDPRLNPIVDPNLSKLGCTRVLVCVAENDRLRDRGEYYYKALGKSGWNGEVELYETKGESNVFQLREPDSANSHALLNKVSSFVNKHA